MSEPWGPRRIRENHDRDREIPDGSWPNDVETPVRREADDDREADRETEGPGVLAVLDDARFSQTASRTTTQKIEWARDAAYTAHEGPWRHANVVFAYAVAAPGTVLCDAIRWALFDKLSRTLLAIPVILAILFVLNQMPLTNWLVPDQWDVSTWLPQAPVDPPGMVEVPIPDGQR